MLDVHPPHEPIHGWRDFLLHLFTITIGLLIALSLEGCVEWQHHRHLVHEAENSLRTEIERNAKALDEASTDVRKQQTSLRHDADILQGIIATGKAPKDSSMEISSSLHSFDDVSWKTAQSTGALSLMPYNMAQEYSDIYNTQGELDAAQHQAARDAILSLAPFMSSPNKNGDPTREQATLILDKIGILHGQLLLVDSLDTALGEHYKKFLAAHP